MSWGSTWAFLFNYNKFISSYSSQVTPFSYSVSKTSPPVIVCTTTATSICHLQRLFQPTINSSTNIFSSNDYHHICININTCTVIPSIINALQPTIHTNSIHHIDIGQQTAWTLDLLLHQYMTQPSSSSLSTAANAPWFKSSSTFSSKFFDSWKYSSSTQCPSSLLWTHWSANNEGPLTDRWRMYDHEYWTVCFKVGTLYRKYELQNWKLAIIR